MKRLILGPHKDYRKKEGDVLLRDIYPIEWPADFEDAFGSIIAINVVEKQYSLVDFMNNAWESLQKGGTLHIETPLAGGDADKQYADPTIVRCYRLQTFRYFTVVGINEHGYTDKPWAILNLTLDNSVIKALLTPIK